MKFVYKRPGYTERVTKHLIDNNPMMNSEIAYKQHNSQRGMKRPEKCGDNNPMRRPDVIARFSGTNHPNWNPNREQVLGGYDELFKINAPKVRKGDNYICQLCFKSGKIVHHIDENKKDSRMENMVTLCQRDNVILAHKDGGIWSIFYQPYFKEIAKVIIM